MNLPNIYSVVITIITITKSILFSIKFLVFSLLNIQFTVMLSFFKKNAINDGELLKISRQYTNKNDEIQIGEEAANLAELGYNSPEDLKETIYGERT